MKRLLAWLLAMLLLPAAALAAPAAPYDVALMLRYADLTGTQQALFDLLYDAAQRQETRVALPADTRYTDVDAAADALISDCPELCALENRYAVGYYQDEPDIALYVTLSYSLTQEQQTELLRRAAEMAASVSGDDWQRAVQLEERLCTGTVYRTDAPSCDNAYGALVDGAAVCEGYARAMLLLTRLAGIPGRLMSGTAWNGSSAEAHAWNLLQLDGAYTQADPTWDDAEGSGVTHWYFGLTDSAMAADHQWEAAPQPCTDEAMNWHRRMGLLLPEDEETARAAFAGAVKRLVCEGTAVNLRFTDAEMYRDFVENSDGWLAAYNAANPQTAFDGAYSLMLSDAQQCVLLCRAE